MIFARITGGLGNQMFQYAAAKSLALKRGEELFLDISNYSFHPSHQGFELIHLFECNASIATEYQVIEAFGWRMQPIFRNYVLRPRLRFLRNKNIISENDLFSFSEIKKSNVKSYLSGYWQSEKYFKDIENLIRHEFSFKIEMNSDNKKLTQEISSENSVGVHVRRGDYFYNAKARNFHGLLPLQYYKLAISRMAKKVSNPIFFVFSDDPAWALENFPSEFPMHFISHNVGLLNFNDMRMMSLCKHNIIANSSFSWWAAWLNKNPEKIVITPKNWFASGTAPPDLIPESWLRI